MNTCCTKISEASSIMHAISRSILRRCHDLHSDTFCSLRRSLHSKYFRAILLEGVVYFQFSGFDYFYVCFFFGFCTNYFSFGICCSFPLWSIWGGGGGGALLVLPFPKGPALQKMGLGIMVHAAVRQMGVHQEITMGKHGTLPAFLYQSLLELDSLEVH